MFRIILLYLMLCTYTPLVNANDRLLRFSAWCFIFIITPLQHLHIKATARSPEMTNWHLAPTSVVSTGSQISPCEKVRFVKASPGSHVKLINLHSNSVGCVVVGAGVGVGVDVGVGSTSVDSCDKTWLHSKNRIR